MKKYATSLLAIVLTCGILCGNAFASDDSNANEFDSLFGAIKSAKSGTKAKQSTNSREHEFHSKDDFENLAGSGPPQSMDQINREIAAHAQSPLGYIERGNSFILDGDDAPALRDFEQALKLAPKSPQAHIGRARVMESMGKWNIAFDELHKAQLLGSPETARNVLWESAFFHRELKQFDIARQQFDELLKMKNLTGAKRAIAMYQKGEIDERSNKPELVVKDMNEVIKSDSLMINAYKTRARAYWRLNQPAKALIDFNAAIKAEQGGGNFEGSGSLGSDVHALLLERAQVYDSLGQHNAAKSDRATAKQHERDDLQSVPFRSR